MSILFNELKRKDKPSDWPGDESVQDSAVN